jgi:hypothetical protein
MATAIREAAVSAVKVSAVKASPAPVDRMHQTVIVHPAAAAVVVAAKSPVRPPESPRNFHGFNDE